MRFKIYALTICCFLFISNLSAQQDEKSTREKPKLVVGLVIDQMRWDYLYRFIDLYGDDGFRRLLGEGFSFENTMMPYTPTYTAVGHSGIYTGSIPAVHGVIGNYWYDKRAGKMMYCTEDSTVTTIGSTGKAGMMSPVNMWTTTVGDELRLSNNFKSRVYGISLKDRGAILPAGHSANAAYWFDPEVGQWISSSYYMKELPAYVKKFNAKDIPGDYMKGEWKTLLPIKKYTQSTADDREYEDPIPGLTTVTFPHKLSSIKNGIYEAFKYTPFAATYTFDFAKAIVDNEKPGQNDVTDFLAISISSTDYAGHHFGPNSIEVQDSYLRLDKDIAEFLKYLDKKLGKANYLFFLSADHAVAHIPGFLKENKLPSEAFSNRDLKTGLNSMIEKKYGLTNVIPAVMNFQVYIDKKLIALQQKDESLIIADVINYLKEKTFITSVVETEKINAASIPEPQRERMINGYSPIRSGDIQFTTKPEHFDSGTSGTTHGAWNPYDAHIPLIFFGWNIKAGKSYEERYMTDIAPTISAMLQIQMPNGSVGKVLSEVVVGSER